jgi:hypothetical protein
VGPWVLPLPGAHTRASEVNTQCWYS